jgi:hypothetical protein
MDVDPKKEARPEGRAVSLPTVMISLHTVIVAGQHAALLEPASRTTRARIISPKFFD